MLHSGDQDSLLQEGRTVDGFLDTLVGGRNPENAFCGFRKTRPAPFQVHDDNICNPSLAVVG